jgi:hypothetical protein
MIKFVVRNEINKESLIPYKTYIKIMKSRKIRKKRNTSDDNGMVTLLNKEENSEIIPIQTILRGEDGVDPVCFNYTYNVIRNIQLNFEDEYDKKVLEVTHFTFYEFVYNIVKLTLNQQQNREDSFSV